jgi:hypothetical protein
MRIVSVAVCLSMGVQVPLDYIALLVSREKTPFCSLS